jgi:Ser/Thr protein kinase RdoA (MazF antagonist)
VEATIPPSVLAHYSDLAGRPYKLYGTGLINATFLVDGRRGNAIVQRLHPVFTGVVNEDIDAVTAHLERRGLTTPRPIRADDGSLWIEGEDGRPWRALTFIEGHSVDRVDSPSVAREGGRLVARFHAATSDLCYAYRHVRVGVHDTKSHIAALRSALDELSGHRLYGDVEALARPLLAEAESLTDLSLLPERHCHGDLKISNLLFRGEEGLCLVDLDTLGRMQWPVEMGDAMRSWCNPKGEDEARATFDAAIFAAALDGYGSVARPLGLVRPEEAQALVEGVLTNCLELAARFLADALRERYFGFNAGRYATRGDHNLVRGAGQLRLYESVKAQRHALERAASLSLSTHGGRGSG